MSDSKNKSLTDRGWDQMRTALDREMPVQRRRRPILWLWLVGFAAFMIVGVYFVGVGSHPQPHTDSEPQPPIERNAKDVIADPSQGRMDDNQVATIGSVTDPGTEKYIDKTLTENLTIEKENKINAVQTVDKDTHRNLEETVDHSRDDSQESTGDRLVATDILRTSNTTRLSGQDIEQVTSVDQPLDKRQSLDMSTDDHKDALKKLSVRVEEINDDQDAINGDRGLLQPSVIKHINSSETYPVSVAAIQIPEDNIKKVLPLTIQSMYSHLSMSPYMVGRITSDIDPRGFGFELGGGVTVGSARFRPYLQTTYGQTVMSGRSATETASVAVDDVSVSGGSEEVIEVLKSLDAQNPGGADAIYRLSYLSLESGLQVMLRRKWSLSAGLGYTRYLSVTNSEVSYTSGNPEIQPTLLEYNSRGEEDRVIADFRRNELAISVGTGYQLNSNIHLGVNYRLGLNMLVDGSDTEQSNDFGMGGFEAGDNSQVITPYRRSFIGLELRYTF